MQLGRYGKGEALLRGPILIHGMLVLCMAMMTVRSTVTEIVMVSIRRCNWLMMIMVAMAMQMTSVTHHCAFPLLLLCVRPPIRNTSPKPHPQTS